MYYCEIQLMYDDYCEECKENGIEPQFKTPQEWWESLE